MSYLRILFYANNQVQNLKALNVNSGGTILNVISVSQEISSFLDYSIKTIPTMENPSNPSKYSWKELMKSLTYSTTLLIFLGNSRNI